MNVFLKNFGSGYISLAFLLTSVIFVRIIFPRSLASEPTALQGCRGAEQYSLNFEFFQEFLGWSACFVFGHDHDHYVFVYAIDLGYTVISIVVDCRLYIVYEM